MDSECEDPTSASQRALRRQVSEVGAVCGNSARTDLCGGRRVTDVPTATPINEREIVLLTNLLHFGPTTIAAIYKDRWEIELFFKALKQNLRVKSFVGTSRNALLIQIWTALIAMLLLKWLHHLSKAKWSFSNLASMLRLNLFTYRDLRRWLENPFGTPPLVPLTEQLSLELS